MIEILPNWHPVFVHFPIAFATTTVVMLAAGILFSTRPWAGQCLVFGRWIFFAAVVSACVAAIFGWFAFNSVAHDDAGHLAMTIHRNWALAAVSLLVLLGAWALRSWRSTGEPSKGLFALITVSWLLVVSAAWHGGEAVYRHGLGVLSIPEQELVGHSHGHGDDPFRQGAQTHIPLSGSNGNAVQDDSSRPEKAGHVHAPGTEPHQD